jgi:hypothetical protein
VPTCRLSPRLEQEGSGYNCAEQVTAFYGTDEWQAIKDGRDQGLLDAAKAREEYVN